MTTYLNMLIFHSNDDESNLTNLLLTGLQSLPSACSVSLASVIKGASLHAAGAQSSRAQSPLAPRRIHGVHAPRAQLPLRSPPRARSRFLAPRPARAVAASLLAPRAPSPHFARSRFLAPRPGRAVAFSLLAPRAQSPPRSPPRARRRRTAAAVASSLPTPSAQSPPRSPPRTRRRRQAAASLAPRAQSSPCPARAVASSLLAPRPGRGATRGGLG